MTATGTAGAPAPGSSADGALDATVGVRLGTLELDVALRASAGTVVAVLGPNGSGKTTLLRSLAGLVALDRGAVRLDGRVLDDPATSTFVEPEYRTTGYVHQGLLLFPNLSVLDNVAFGLRSRGIRKGPSRHTAMAWLERMGVADYATSRPTVLSGGQAQRVALARALAVDPALLLLDEPLSALDVATRAETRRDLRRHLDDFAGVTVLVTHDPLDAVLLADEIVILEAGRVTQVGTTAEVTARPRTRYVADLVGTNLLRGIGHGRQVVVEGTDTVVVVSEPAPTDALVSIAPSAVALHRTRPEGSVRNAWPVTVDTIDLLGDRVRVGLTGPTRLVAEVTPAGLAALGTGVDDELWASVKATEVHVYPA